MARRKQAQFGRRRSRRRYRILNSTRVAPSIGNFDIETLTVYRDGLRAAKLLQRYFPAVYSAHVAYLTITLGSMLRVMRLFLALAHYHLMWLDECHTEFFAPLDPIKEFLEWEDPDDYELDWMINTFPSMITNPQPLFFGLPHDLECLYPGNADDNALLIMLILLVKETDWRDCWGEEWYESDLNLFLDSSEVCDAIARVGSLPADTNLVKLCNYLDTQSICLDHGDLPNVRWLGSIIRYALRQMKNEFADYSPTMIAESFGGFSGVNWESSPDDIAWHRNMQAAAAAVSLGYDQLDEVLKKNPQLIQRLADCLASAAAEVRSMPDIPRPAIPQSDLDSAIARYYGLTSEKITMTSSGEPLCRQPRQPWKRVHIRPRRLPQEDIVHGDSQPDAQISIWGDGTTLLTRRDDRYGWRCYPIRWDDIVQTLARVPTSSGILPPNTVATGFINGCPWFLIYIPPMQRTIRVLQGKELQTYTLQTPPLLWSAEPSVTPTSSYRIFALAEQPHPDAPLEPNTILHEAPFPNCRSGQICWGRTTPPLMDSSEAALAALELFLAGTLFNEHWVDGKSSAFPTNVILLYRTLSPEQPYPLSDLVPLDRNNRLQSLITPNLR